MNKSSRLFRRWLRPLLGDSLLPLFALILLAAMWGAMFYQVGLEREVAHGKAVGQSQAQARALSDYIGNILRQAGHATHLFKLKYEETGGRFQLAEFARPGGLLDTVLPVRLAIPMAVYDADGKLATSLNRPIPASAEKTPWFATLAASSADAELVTTSRDTAHGTEWHLLVARRLSAADGSYAGAIVMVIDPGLFVDDYDRLDIDDRSAVILMSQASGLSAGRLGESLFTSATLDFRVAGATARRLAEVVPGQALDEVDRIYAASEMARYQLIAVVGIPRGVAMASFERQRMAYIALGLIGGFLIIAVSVLLMKQNARLRASMLAAREAQATLRGAVHGSLDAFMVLKAARGPAGQVEDFVIADINAIGAQMLKRPRQELIGRKAFALLPRFAKTGLFSTYVHALETGLPQSAEFELRIENDPPFWIHHQVVPIENGVAVTSRDITRRKQEEIETRTSRNFLQSLINNLPLLVCVKSARPDSFGRMMIWNQAAEAMTGYRADQVIGKRDSEAFPPGFGLSGDEGDRAMADTPMVVDLPEKPLMRPDGTWRYLHAITVPLFDGGGALEYILCMAEDVTLRREQEINLRDAVAALRESGARLHTVADALPAMIAYVEANGVCRFHNKAYLAEYGKGRPSLVGLPPDEAIGAARYRMLKPHLDRAMLGETVVFEQVEKVGSGITALEIAHQVSYIPQLGEDGVTVIGCHIMRQDVTPQYREKKRLIKLTQVDALTGLTNRAGFMQKLDDAMHNSEIHNSLMAVMFMDIDRFKPVNDTFGHNAGDALLRAFSARLTHTLRASDTIARLGGDEFTIIMEKLTRQEDAALIAGKIVAAMQAPFELDGATVSVSTSIGLAFYRGGPVAAVELLKQADVLLYEAKQAGRNTFRAAACAIVGD
ncbi:MAG: diguanylate cyclase domain-containing protein [Telluria sp.]